MDPTRMIPPHRKEAPPMAYQLSPPPPPSSSTDTSFPILTISIIGILTTAILLVSYYIFVIKCYLNWRRSDVISRLSNTRSRGRRREPPFAVFATATENRGLEESVIRAIPIIRYRKGGDREEKKSLFYECAVCLNEFQEEERLRLLPNCCHAFHIDCIDTWLQTNDNCPICRSDATNPIPSDQFMAQRILQDQNHSDGMVVEVRDDAIDLTPMTVSSEQFPVTTHHNRSPRKPEQRPVHKKVRKLQHVSSMGDECIDVRCKDDLFSIQPIRRSFSMDSSCDRQLYLAVQEMLQQKPQRVQEASSGTGEGASSVGGSARVRRSFFSFGHGRSSRNAILPISIDDP